MCFMIMYNTLNSPFDVFMKETRKTSTGTMAVVRSVTNIAKIATNVQETTDNSWCW